MARFTIKVAAILLSRFQEVGSPQAALIPCRDGGRSKWLARRSPRCLAPGCRRPRTADPWGRRSRRLSTAISHLILDQTAQKPAPVSKPAPALATCNPHPHADPAHTPTTPPCQVIYLDADNIPLKDPAHLLDGPEYNATGALLWQDFWDNTMAPEVGATRASPCWDCFWRACRLRLRPKRR